MNCLFCNMLILSTLSESRVQSRKIIAFPDIDGYHTWLTKSTDFPFLDLRVSDLLEKNATPADREAHIDLADWLIQYLEDKNA